MPGLSGVRGALLALLGGALFLSQAPVHRAAARPVHGTARTTVNRSVNVNRGATVNRNAVTEHEPP